MRYKHNDLYLISSLNEQSVLLAESIRKREQNTHRKSVILFTDIVGIKSIPSDLREKIRLCRCMLTHKNICDISLKHRSPQALTRAVFISSDEAENLSLSLRFIENNRNKANAEIYTFSSSKESECLLDAIDKGTASTIFSPLKVRRVNAVRNQIYHYLLTNSIFEHAQTVYDEKVISILFLGLGTYGMELLQNILWFGQMQGYVLKITVVDQSPDAEELFYMNCPGIRQRGTQPKNGEDYYELTFYPGMNVFSESFYSLVTNLPETTQVFVALGNEQNNLELSLKLRSIFSGLQIDAGKKPVHDRQAKQSPVITAVIHNAQKAALLNTNQLCNFKKQYYDISCLGNNEELYSYENIFSSVLEKMALEMHLQWGDAESFHAYEYYRRSSLATAIHKKYREELLPDDEELSAMSEHTRWNAYMRAVEGYSFGYIRDDLALRHSSLIKYDYLSRMEKKKDIRMNQVSFKPKK